jgi:hypothetical protein
VARGVGIGAFAELEVDILEAGQAAINPNSAITNLSASAIRERIRIDRGLSRRRPPRLVP